MGWLKTAKKIVMIAQKAANVVTRPFRATIFLDEDTDLLSARKSDGSLVVLEGGDAGLPFTVEFDAQGNGTVTVGTIPVGKRIYAITTVSDDTVVNSGAPAYNYEITGIGDVTTAQPVSDLTNNEIAAEAIDALQAATEDNQTLSIVVSNGGDFTGTWDIIVKFV